MFKYKIENNEVTITGIIDKSLEHITIPETIDGLPVIKINYDVLWYNRELSNIVIPTSINTLPYYVFVNSPSLTHINNIELKYNKPIIHNNKFIICGKRSYKIIYQMCDDYYCCGLYYHYFIDEKPHNTDFGEY